MEHTGWIGSRRSTRLQALVLAVALPADGAVAYALGAPAWLAVLYLGLGIVLASAWLGLRRRARRAVAEPPPAPVLEPPTPSGKAGAIGYLCVSAAGNADQREQTAAIKACCDERGLRVISVVHDVEGASRDQQRPSLAWALEQIASERADTLVVARLRDLAPNVANLPPLLTWFNAPSRTLIAIDLHLDTSTDAGQLAAAAIAGVGSWEHERLSERTRRGLEAARSRGNGHGRSAVADVPELQERIARMREDGMTLQAIADALNADGVPTLRGGAMWRPSSVQRAAGYRRPSSATRGIELPKSDPPER